MLTPEEESSFIFIPNTSTPPTNTSKPLTNTSTPPTNTSKPPTKTSTPLTNTSAPTNTSTPTNTSKPLTSTSTPPTNTSTPTNSTPPRSHRKNNPKKALDEMTRKIKHTFSKPKRSPSEEIPLKLFKTSYKSDEDDEDIVEKIGEETNGVDTKQGTLMEGTLQVDTLQEGTFQVDTPQEGKLQLDTLQLDTPQEGTLQEDTLQEGTLQEGTLMKGTLQVDTIQEDTLQEGTLMKGTLQVDTIQEDIIQEGTLQEGTLQESILQESTLKECTLQEGILQVSTLLEGTLQVSTLQESTLQVGTLQEGTLQESTLQVGTLQEGTLHESTLQEGTLPEGTSQKDPLMNDILIETMEPEKEVPKSPIPKNNMDPEKEVPKTSLPKNIMDPEKEVPETPIPKNIEGLPVEHTYSHKIKRHAAMMEILTTEQSYVRFLKIVIRLVLNPCLTQKILSDDDCQTVFSVLKSIYAVNRKLLEMIEERMKDFPENGKIGDIFIEMADYFKAYCSYCDNYDRAVIRVVSLQKENSQFEKLLQDFEANPKAMNMSLNMYLIMPVQRIPRYFLLLQALSQYTPADHPDHEDITRAAAKLKMVAQYVNNSVKNTEKKAHLFEIAKRFVNLAGEKTIVEPHRTFIKEGIVTKRSLSDDKLQQRMAYLFNDVFLTASTLGNLQKIDKFIPLSLSWLIDKHDGFFKNAFWLITQEKTHCFLLHSMEAKQEWMRAINDATAELISNNIQLAKQRENYVLVMSPSSQSIPVVVHMDHQEEASRLIGRTVSKRPKLRGLINNSLELVKGIIQPYQEEMVAQTKEELFPTTGMVNISLDMKALGVNSIYGFDLATEDIRQDSFPINSVYIVFPPSYNYFFGRSIGFIGIKNISNTECVLVARRRYVACSDEPSSYVLKPSSDVYFDFKGHWCLEVAHGPPPGLQVVDFNTFGGSGKPENNILKMV